MGITVHNSEINNYHLLSTDYKPDTLRFSIGSYNPHNNPPRLVLFFLVSIFQMGTQVLKGQKTKHETQSS